MFQPLLLFFKTDPPLNQLPGGPVLRGVALENVPNAEHFVSCERLPNFSKTAESFKTLRRRLSRAFAGYLRGWPTLLPCGTFPVGDMNTRAFPRSIQKRLSSRLCNFVMNRFSRGYWNRPCPTRKRTCGAVLKA